jgi:hypothetical protein
MKTGAICSMFAIVLTVATCIWDRPQSGNAWPESHDVWLIVLLTVGGLSIASIWSYLRISPSPRRPRFLLCSTITSVVATLFCLMQWVSYYE